MAIITGNFIIYVDKDNKPHDALITDIKENGLLNLVYLETKDNSLIGYRHQCNVAAKEPGVPGGWVELKYYGQEIK